jgi:uroporphyrinogen III methyltransferase / synthase
MKEASKPLQGLRILITRPREQLKPLAEEIIRLGGTPIEFPTISIEPTHKEAQSGLALETLNGYDWIVFTSANGVRYLFEEASMQGADFADISSRIAVVGPATAAAAEQAGLRVSFTPSTFLTEQLARELSEVDAKHILLVRAEGTDEKMRSILIERGAKVDEIHPYRVTTSKHTGALEAYDAILFTSPSTVSSFVEITGVSQLRDQGKIVCCIGPVTAKAAESKGFRVDVIAQEHSTKGLLGALVAKVTSR